MARSDSRSARTLAGRIGAYTVHSRYDSRHLTAQARASFLARFEHEVDPHQVLPKAERARRAQAARSAHMSKLALLSARRRKARTGRSGGSR